MTEIQRITEADDAQLVAIIRRNLEHFHLDIPGTAYYDPELDHMSRYYAQKPDRRAYFVVKDAQGRVLGGCGFAEFPGIEGCAELQKLYLADEVKGQGLGKRLVETVEAQAARCGYHRLYLETHTSLEVALHLYEKMGFHLIEKPASALHSTMDRFYLKQIGE